jgi:hypothetical protein
MPLATLRNVVLAFLVAGGRFTFRRRRRQQPIPRCFGVFNPLIYFLRSAQINDDLSPRKPVRRYMANVPLVFIAIRNQNSVIVPGIFILRNHSKYIWT